MIENENTYVLFSATRRISRITFIMYAHGRKIGSSNILKVFSNNDYIILDSSWLIERKVFHRYIWQYNAKFKINDKCKDVCYI
jgi:hypothetical protein